MRTRSSVRQRASRGNCAPLSHRCRNRRSWPGRALRVLVIADPCEESPLAGAQEEGEAVAQLFEQFKDAGANVEVVRLFGPSEATRVAVLDCLINQRFDLVHYAGHCSFNADDPPRSGWLFSRNEVLSAYELSRIDRVPRFVFSNACESGITPDRADDRHAGLAPSFAEAFFECGVGNFICTAWPVDDAAALAFATRVYRGLLGLLATGAESLHEAIKAARLEIAKLGDGGRATWGAYQHYGDPYFRIGRPPTTPASRPSKPARPKTRSHASEAWAKAEGNGKSSIERLSLCGSTSRNCRSRSGAKRRGCDPVLHPDLQESRLQGGE